MRSGLGLAQDYTPFYDDVLMTLAEHLRENWATSRGVLQRQLSALDRGELAGAFTNEQLTIVRNAIQGGIAIYDRLLRLGMVE